MDASDESTTVGGAVRGWACIAAGVHGVVGAAFYGGNRGVRRAPEPAECCHAGAGCGG